MSSLAVRNWFKAQLPSRVPTVPYFDTINRVPNNKTLPDLWCTLEFNSATETRVSLGTRACFREFGEVVMVVLGKSGKGDSAVITAAELIRNQFFGIHVAVPYGSPPENGFLILDAADPPNTDISESGDWFLASVSCSYSFDTVRGV